MLPLLDALRVVGRRRDRRPAPRRLRRCRPGRGAARPRRSAGSTRPSVRALARALRAREAAAHAAAARAGSARPSLEPGVARAALDGEPARRRRAGSPGCCATPARALDDGGTAEEALWALWARHRLAAPAARRRRARRASAPGSRTATSTRSARCSRPRPAPRSSAATPASRTSSRRCAPSRSPPTRSPTAASAATRSGCSPRTAPRASSGAWSWSPTCRRAPGPTCAAAATLLQADRIGPRRPAAADHHARRCSPRSAGCSTSPCTRARERLVVTAVAVARGRRRAAVPVRRTSSAHRAGAPRRAGPRRPLSLAGLVAELRRTVADPDQPEPLRRAAAAPARALLADDRRATAARSRRRRPRDLVGPPRADADPSGRSGPATSRCTLSASALEGLLDLPGPVVPPARGRRRGRVSSTSQGFGKVVHALAERIGRRRRSPTSTRRPDAAASTRCGAGCSSARPWSGAREREAVADALTRFLPGTSRPERPHRAGHRAAVRGRGDAARRRRSSGSHGYADRLELDDDGRVVVVDLKTSKYPPTGPAVRDNPSSASTSSPSTTAPSTSSPGDRSRSGGAELVQLRQDDGGCPRSRPQAPQQPDATGARRSRCSSMRPRPRVRAEEFVGPARASTASAASSRRSAPTKAAGTVLS